MISASNDRFVATKALHKKGRACRTDCLDAIKASCTSAVQQSITDFMFSSNKFKLEYQASKTRLSKEHIEKNEIADFKGKSRLIRIHLPGIVASWSPSGKYKSACPLDYYRFHILRPPQAEELERNDW